MKRRDILKYTAAATGAAVCAPLAASLLSGCEPASPAGPGEGLHAFTRSQFDVLTRIVDVVLPKTDSPSAIEVEVHHIIDRMVGTVYPPEAREKYINGFDVLAAFVKSEGEPSGAIGKIEGGLGDIDEEVINAYGHLKQQTIAYYLSTETIGKNFLNYLPVPGPYQACISLEEAGGKAWAL